MRATVLSLLHILTTLSVIGCVDEDPLEAFDYRDYDGAWTVQTADTQGAPADTGTEMRLPCGAGECCMKDGVAYDQGETLRIPCDGCENICTCNDDGAWSCTDCSCASACYYEGTSYSPGDTFRAADGCNQCECELVHLGFGFSEARITCTGEVCAPPVCDREGIDYVAGNSVVIPCAGCDNRCTCVQQSAQWATWECTECECARECVYEDVPYAVGEVFLASDGCNWCECELEDLSLGFTEARVVCTAGECTEPMCFFDGVAYSLGDDINLWCSSRVGKVCTCASGDEMPFWDCQEEDPCEQTCTYMEQTYAIGERFLAEDRCNTCECRLVDKGLGLMQALVECTRVPCEAPKCSEAGVLYEADALIRVPCDGCENTCVCVQHDAERASWDCTACECRKTCEYGGATHRPGEVFPATDGCNVCTCEMVDLGFEFQEARVVCTNTPC